MPNQVEDFVSLCGLLRKHDTLESYQSQSFLCIVSGSKHKRLVRKSTFRQKVTVQGHVHFLPLRLWRLIEAKNIIYQRTLWHFNSTFSSSLSARSAYQRFTLHYLLSNHPSLPLLLPPNIVQYHKFVLSWTASYLNQFGHASVIPPVGPHLVTPQSWACPCLDHVPFGSPPCSENS